MKIMKKLFSILLAGTLVLSMSTVALAAETSEATAAEKAAQITLYPGEILVDDTIIGLPIVSEPNMSSAVLMASSDCPNYAVSTETAELHYSGYIQFQASYLTQDGDGYGLVADRHVKQAWIDYERNDTSVIGGKKYTSAAASKTDETIYSQSASCWDSLLDWGESGTTYFCRGWLYFT